MPWISFLIRQVYGVQGAMQYRPNSHFYRRYAWPSGHWGSMHIEGGTTAAFRRVIESAPDPEAKRLELEAKFRVYDSPFRTAEATGLDIIDPRDSRPPPVRVHGHGTAHSQNAARAGFRAGRIDPKRAGLLSVLDRPRHYLPHVGERERRCAAVDGDESAVDEAGGV